MAITPTKAGNDSPVQDLGTIKIGTPRPEQVNGMQSVLLPDLNLVKEYPTTMSDSEIDFDTHVNLRANTPEDYHVNSQPNSIFQSVWKGTEAYMRYGQEAMKLLAVRPDVALGISKEISPDQLAKVYQPWSEIWTDTMREYAPTRAIKEGTDKLLTKAPLAVAFAPWFVTEFVPEQLLEFGTKPVNWVGAYGIEKLGPVVLNKALSALPAPAREFLLKDIFKSEVKLASDFETLGIQPNTPTSEVVKAWKSRAFETHPDKGGSADDFIKAREAFDNIMSTRQTFLNKILDNFRPQSKGSKPNLKLSSESGSADLVPNFEPGDLAKVGSDIVKVTNIAGKMATVNLAGKMVQKNLSELTPYVNPNEKQIIPITIKDFNQQQSPLEEANIKVDSELIDKVNQLQNILGKQIKISSGYRTPEYNQLLKSQGYKVAENSLHMSGRAADIPITKDLTHQEIVDAAHTVGLDVEAIKLTPKHVHVELPTDNTPTFELQPKGKEVGNINPENPPTEAAVNLERIETTDVAKSNLKKATDLIGKEIENQTGKTLSHEEVINKAQESEILKSGVSRESTLNFEGALLKTRQHLAALAEQPELTKEFLDTLKIVANTGTDIARQLESFKISALPEYATQKVNIIKKLQEIGVETDKIIEASKGVDFKDQQQVAKFYRQFVKPTIPEILDEFAYMNILSSPKTHIVNAFSNMIQLAGLNPLTKLASGGVDKIASSLTGKERTHYLSEVPNFYKGVINAVPEAYSNAATALQGKTYVERPDIKHIPTLSPFLDYATLGLGKYVTRALEASDIFFHTLIEKGEIEALSERFGGTPTDKEMIQIAKEAKQRAEYYVFRQKPDAKNKNGQGDVLSAIDKMTSSVYRLREVPGAKWFIRFVQTPMNILKQGAEYSPLGFTTLKGAKDKSEQIGKAIIGSAVFAGSYYVAMSGNSTWALPKSQKERKMFYEAGRVPYSVKIGDRWVSYSKLGPLAYPLAMGAALNYYEKESPNALSDSQMEKVSRAMGGVMGFFSDQSYVQSLGDFLKTIEGDPQAVSRMASNVPTQLIPLVSLQRWINGIIDPIYRKPESGVSAEALKENLMNSIVGLSQFLPAQKDVFGQPAKKQDALLNSVSPMQSRKSNDTADQVLKVQNTAKQQKNKFKKIKEEALENAKDK